METPEARTQVARPKFFIHDDKVSITMSDLIDWLKIYNEQASTDSKERLALFNFSTDCVMRVHQYLVERMNQSEPLTTQVNTFPKPIGYECGSCSGRGYVSKPQHGHAVRCERCSGKGWIQEKTDK